MPLLIARGFVRILILFLSYGLATLAAALMLTATLFLGGDLSWLEEDELVVLGSFGFALASWWTIFHVGIAPSLITICIAEMARLQSFVINLILGGFCSLAIVFLTGGVEQIQLSLNEAYPQNQLWASILSAGFVAGAIHWMIAGHRAGRWMGD